MSSKDKKNKKKNVYIDDGRPIVDMSSYDSYYGRNNYKSSSSFKEKMKTYFESVKLMFLPMLVVMALISVVFLLLYVLFSLA